MIAVQTRLQSRDRDVRHLHDACESRSLRGVDRVRLELHLVERRRRHEEHSRHARARTIERRGVAEIADHDVVVLDGPPHERTHGHLSLAHTAHDPSTQVARSSDHEHLHEARGYVSSMRQPRRGPGIGRELTVAQQLACALRILAGEGWRENLSGHITIATADGGMYCNPWGIWWDEVRASDIVRVDADGAIVAGQWDVTPAVFLHTELHRARADAAVIVHNHPYYATLLAAMGELPRPVHQNSCIFDGELALVDEYSGIEDANDGKWLARAVGDASGILLAHHGAVVTAPTIEEACYKAATFERMCRFTYDMLAAGHTPHEIPADARAALKPTLRQNAPLAYWDGAVRELLRTEPETLD